jgi:DNA ligase-1
MTNENILEKDELGYAKRSYKKDGMVAANTLGNFIVSYNNMVISVAPGKFNHDLRKTIWNSQNYYIGKILKFRFFAHGIKDKPRFPRAIGFRSKIDL